MALKDNEPKETDIQCLTVHASKGKEIGYFFISALGEDEQLLFKVLKKVI